MAELADVGERHNARFRRGAKWGPFTVEMLDENGAAYDLTGCTIYGQLLKLSGESAAELDVDITNEAGGEYTFGLTAAGTASLALGKYTWILLMDTPDRDGWPLMHGDATVLVGPDNG